MSIGSRIKEAREKAGYSQVKLSEIIGISKGAIGNYESDKSSPKDVILFKIMETLHVDANYLFQDEMAKQDPDADKLTDQESAHIKKYRLLTQAGKKTVDSMTVMLVEYESEVQEAEPDNIIPLRRLPEYEIGVSAGTGNPIDDSPYDIVEVDGEAPIQTSYLLRADGDSMEPLIHDGERLYIQQTNQVEDGEIGIYFYSGSVYVKKLVQKHGKLYLVSLNPKYPPIQVEEGEELRCEGKVLNK